MIAEKASDMIRGKSRAQTVGERILAQPAMTQ